MTALIAWSTLKAFADSKSLPVQWYEADNTYFIFLIDGLLQFEARIYKDGSSDQTEFEAGYKNSSTANVPLWQYDSDGAQVVRTKAAKRGWTFSAIPLEFSTSALNASLFCKTQDGSDRAGVSLKLYNGLNVEITVPGALNINLTTATRTVIDFEPPYDYELIGGALRTKTDILSDMRLWIIAVPDIPAASGGSKEMAGGINLRYLTPGNVYQVDGRVSKLMTYNSSLHTNKLRFIFEYPAGTSEDISMVIELYKQ